MSPTNALNRVQDLASALVQPVSAMAERRGKTSRSNNVITPLDVQLGITNIAPDKLNLTATALPTPELSFSLGMDRTMNRTVRTGTTVTERTKGRTLFDATVASNRWIDDFVNHRGISAEQRNPNAGLRINLAAATVAVSRPLSNL